jgi:hypothetical protein
MYHIPIQLASYEGPPVSACWPGNVHPEPRFKGLIAKPLLTYLHFRSTLAITTFYITSSERFVICSSRFYQDLNDAAVSIYSKVLLKLRPWGYYPVCEMLKS